MIFACFFYLGNRQRLTNLHLLQNRSDVHSKVTFLLGGGKKKHVTVLPGFCPPLFTSHQKSAGIIVWCPSWCQQFPRFRHLSRRMLTSLLPTLLFGNHPKKGNPPKNPHAKHHLLPLSLSFQVRFCCQNYFHLSFRAVMQFTCIEQPPTQGFQQNLLKLQISSGNSWAFGMPTNKNPEPTLKNNLKKNKTKHKS